MHLTSQECRVGIIENTKKYIKKVKRNTFYEILLNGNLFLKWQSLIFSVFC